MATSWNWGYSCKQSRVSQNTLIISVNVCFSEMTSGWSDSVNLTHIWGEGMSSWNDICPQYDKKNRVKSFFTLWTYCLGYNFSNQQYLLYFIQLICTVLYIQLVCIQDKITILYPRKILCVCLQACCDNNISHITLCGYFLFCCFLNISQNSLQDTDSVKITICKVFLTEICQPLHQ